MAERGTYCDLTTLKNEIENSSELVAADDAVLLDKLEVASRMVDDFCRRHFYIVSGTRYYSPASTGEFLCPDDILSLSAIYGDKDNDRTWGDTWAASDYELYPFNEYPRWKILRRPDGDYSFLIGNSRLKLVGEFGHGDGSADPTRDSGTDTAEALDATETGVDVVDGTKLKVGYTIKVESEQMYVTAVASNTATVERGVNGTTAATHTTGKDVRIYQYPNRIVQVTKIRALKLWRRKDVPGGVAGPTDFGPGTMRIYVDLDRDEQGMIARFRKGRAA